ncbi:MAG: glycosyltransferase [Bacteroidales bacterium]|nr:glycosyltransferase [Bacteroidales bacterium]
MKHAILILAHKNFDHLSELIRFFRGEFYIYIHIDKKAVISQTQWTALSEMENVRLIESRYSVNWGGRNILKSTLFLMRAAIKEGLADYYHLISGQDFPTKTPEEIDLFFEQRKGTEFLEYFSLPYAGWENGTMDRLTLYNFYDQFDFKSVKGNKMLDKLITWQKRHNIHRKLPLKKYPVFYGGSSWWSLSRACVQYLVDETDCDPSLYRRFRYTFACEEVYIQTLLHYSPFKSKMENDNLRFIVWKYRNDNYPANLDETDLSAINCSRTLFARKIEYPVSAPLVEALKNRQAPKIQTDGFPVSVVMSMYNVAPYLKECIDSILNQSFRDFELIIVDDGSTDEGVSIARSYSDPRIRIVENEHNYIASLNRSLQEAKGKYIAKMDADDRMAFERLSVQFSYMELHPEIDICGAWHRIFGEGYEPILRQFPEKHNEIVTTILRKENPMSHPTAFIRKSFLDKHPVQYDPEAIYAEDLQFWIDCIKCGARFENLPCYLHEYRQSDIQVIRTQSTEMFANSDRIYCDFLEYVMELLSQHNERIWQVLEQMILMVNEGIVPFAVLDTFVFQVYSDYLSSSERNITESAPASPPLNPSLP